MEFTNADIIFLIIALIIGFVGFVRGFTKSFFSALGLVLSLACAVFFCKPLAGLLENSALSKGINESIVSWINAKGEFFSLEFCEAGMTNEMADMINLPHFMIEIVNAFISKGVEGLSLSQIIANSLTPYLLLIIAFTIILIGVLIIAGILSGLFGSFVKNDDHSFIDKFFGFIFGLFCSFCCIEIFLALVSQLSIVFPVVGEMITQSIEPNSEKISLIRWLYSHNFIIYLLKLILANGKLF